MVIKLYACEACERLHLVYHRSFMIVLIYEHGHRENRFAIYRGVRAL